MSKIIRSTDENALEELKEKLAQMESAHKEMVARNKHYFKNGTMKGYGDFTDDRAAKMDLAIQGTYEKKPYASYQLQNSNQEIRRIKMRIKALEHEQNREADPESRSRWRFRPAAPWLRQARYRHRAPSAGAWFQPVRGFLRLLQTSSLPSSSRERESALPTDP